MANIFNTLIGVIFVMVFWSFAITAITHSLPDDVVNQGAIAIFQEVDGTYDISQIEADVTENLESQTNIPVIDIGSLVFYSGNLFLDFLLNFVTALPQMLGMLIAALNFILNIDPYFIQLIQATILGLTVVLYILGIISLALNIRSGQRIA